MAPIKSHLTMAYATLVVSTRAEVARLRWEA
jgi:hypothetical protein